MRETKHEENIQYIYSAEDNEKCPLVIDAGVSNQEDFECPAIFLTVI